MSSEDAGTGRKLSWTQRIFLAPITWYQRFISPAFGPRCRYAPTCSAYAREAISVHGAGKGTLLATWRILRCNPLTRGGVDRVPPRGKWPEKPLGYQELLAERAEQENRQARADGCE